MIKRKNNKGKEQNNNYNNPTTIVTIKKKNVAGYSRTGRWDTEAVKQEATRGLTLYTLASRLQSKKQGLTHIWLHATLLATSPPSAM
jgi:hypothetical protein